MYVCICILCKSEYRSCTIGIMAKDENTATRRKEKEIVFRSLHPWQFFRCPFPRHRLLTGIHNSSVGWILPGAPTEVEQWLRWPLTERPKGSRTIWGLRNPLGTGGSLFSSCALRMMMKILSVPYTFNTDTDMYNRALHTSPAVGLESRWSPKVSQSGGGRWPFAFVFAP